MKKDIFIDADVANKFASTKDEHLLELINWLLESKNQSFLMMSDYLRNDCFKGNNHCSKEFSICTIYFQLQKDDRLNVKTKKEIKLFQQKFFNKKVWDKLKCTTNKKGDKSNDPEHIALILLSDRRIALTEDENLLNGILDFPMKGIGGIKATVAKKPQELNYKKSEAA